MEGKNKYLWLGFVLLLSSCGPSNPKSKLDLFLEKLEIRVSSAEINDFENKNISQAILSHSFSAELKELYYDTSYYKEITGLLDRNGVVFKMQFLRGAFYYKLHNKNLDVSELKKELLEIGDDIVDAEMKHAEIIIKKNVKTNNETFFRGDTVQFSFVVSDNSVIFPSYLPSKLYYSPEEDSLQMKAILVDKTYGLRGAKSRQLLFYVRILALDNNDCRIYGRKWEVGDTIFVPLKVYGRLIK